MLTLSLFLSAVAGVNAILGGQVTAVKIAENKWMCADDCAYGGGFFEQRGFFCPEEELIFRVTPDGTDDFYFPFGCAGATHPPGFSERAPRDGDILPSQCLVVNDRFDCPSLRSISGNKETTEWSEIEKQLKEAKAQDGQSSPEKPVVDCTAEGSKAYSECQNEPNPSFDKCNQRGVEAIEKCRQQ